MVAKTASRISAVSASTSKPKSSSSSTSSKASKKSLSSTPASASLISASAKKSLKKATNKKNNKFRDNEKRELLDGQTSQLLASTTGGNGKDGESGNLDPFSYNMPSQAEVRRTRKQVDEAALALDDLMRSF